MPSNAPIAAVVVARQRRKIYEAFRTSSATSPNNAKTLVELDLHDSLLFRIQVRRKAIVQSAANKYYLDEARLLEVDRQRRTTALIAVLVFIVMFVIYLQIR